jgi:long-chain fatty acid transport protein
MQRLRAMLMACALVLLAAQSGAAAGFGIYEWSARGNALGGATVGRGDDPSAIASNPAGITQLDGIRVLGGVTFIHPVVDVRTNTQWTTSDENALWVPPHFYATAKLNDRLSLGVGAFSRFGLGSVFDEDWPGRYNSYEAIIKSVSATPVLAYQISEKWSAAFGLDATYLAFTKQQKIANGAISALIPAGDNNLKLDADGMGYGFNAGIHYRPCPYARLGLTYRSPVTMKVRGDADFTRSAGYAAAASASPLLDAWLRDSRAWGTVTLPDSLAFGLAIYPWEKLSIEAGFVYTWWSKYDALTVNYADAVIPGGKTQTSSIKDWNDVWRFNVGLEYALLPWMDVRLGYVYDESPVPDDTIDYMVPANDRHLLNGGLGFHWDNWTVDLNYTYLIITDRDIDARPKEGVLEGEINDGRAHMLGVSVGYTF